MLRYTKLSDAQVLAKVLEVCKAENIEHSDDGLEAVVFTAQGDMRQALNNLQSTFEGFGFVKSENVFKVRIRKNPNNKNFILALWAPLFITVLFHFETT